MNPAIKIAPYSSPFATPFVVQVQDEASLQRGEKRKIPKDKFMSSSKKKRKIPEGPSLAGSFDLNVHLADRLEYHLAPEDKRLFHGMTTNDAMDMAYELNVQANLCLAYAAGFTNSIIVEELEAARLELEKAKKSNEELSLRFEKLQKTAEDKRQKASASLAKAQGISRQLQKANDDLKLASQNGAARIADLVKERDTLVAAQGKMISKNKALGDEVCNERL